MLQTQSKTGGFQKPRDVVSTNYYTKENNRRQKVSSLDCKRILEDENQQKLTETFKELELKEEYIEIDEENNEWKFWLNTSLKNKIKIPVASF